MVKPLLSIVLVALAFVASIEGYSPPLSSTWKEFKTFHGKVYPSKAVECYRKGIFEKNKISTLAHNKAFNERKVTSTRELNSFADLDPKEFVNKRTGHNSLSTNQNAVKTNTNSKSNTNSLVPVSLDYRTNKKVSPVKDQGECGSCWAFAAVGVIESQVLMNNQTPAQFSEEQILDCDLFKNNPPDNGCDGGNPFTAFEYINKAGGIETQLDYPYFGKPGQTCNFKKSNVALTIAPPTWVNPTVNDVKKALATIGPLSVCICVDEEGVWQGYSGGIYSTQANCKGTNIETNHCLLLIGYGTESGSGNETALKDYWIVKNQYGIGWGIGDGFALISQASGQDCLITTSVTYTTVQQASG